MNVLDANIPIPERVKLRGLRIRCRRIGDELATQDTDDSAILPLLHALGRATFFTRDRDFWRAELCHPRYCLVFLDVPVRELANYIRRFLRHPVFNTTARRLGCVVRVHAECMSVHRNPRGRQPANVGWLQTV